MLHHELKEVEKKIEHEYAKVEQQKLALAQREGASTESPHTLLSLVADALL
jgi:hypothetical protein